MGRRGFLSRVSAAASAAAAWGAAHAAAGEGQKPAERLPTIQIGQHTITRLVAGSNPLSGYSYLGHHMDQHMKEYFTLERTVEFLLACERAGIIAHQFSRNDKTQTVLHKVREQGSKMLFIGLHAGREGIKETVAATRPIAMVHHGGVTDTLLSQGKSREVHDYVKAVHDQGVLAGVSAHNPDCIKQIADEGWEVDLFMTCFYFLTRKHAPEPAGAPAPPKTLQISYAFYEDDPRVMTEVVRQVKQPCLGFKILGAGRLGQSQDMVRQAFRFAFERIKPTDGVIVGMYPRFFDEIGANAQYAREMGKPRPRKGK
jgi:hypothetical protein